MGFAASTQLMVNQAVTHATGLFDDFWPVVAFFVGLAAVTAVIRIFLPR